MSNVQQSTVAMAPYEYKNVQPAILEHDSNGVKLEYINGSAIGSDQKVYVQHKSYVSDLSDHEIRVSTERVLLKGAVITFAAITILVSFGAMIGKFVR